MFGSTTLDIVTGLIFIYLLYSLLATTIQEGIATMLRLRAKTLEEGIKRMLNDSKTGQFATTFLTHTLIKYMGKDNEKTPSYITSPNFSLVLTEVLKEAQTGVDDVEKINNFFENNKNNATGNNKGIEPDTLKTLKIFWDNADHKIDIFKTNIEKWYDDTMDRVSGWYKRKTQRILLIIGLLLAIIFNIDSIKIVKKLSIDKDARNGLVNMAVKYNKSHKTLPTETDMKTKAGVDSKDTLFFRVDSTLNAELQGTNSLLGLGKSWKIFCDKDYCWGLAILGWFITALAISLGAPFWFDLLQKVISLRGTGDTPEETEKKKAALTKPN
ncbi:MAG TPA: hypothetical protein VK705_02230 [Ferruginibacter sp.]|jgi:hypothetical protein|nr:hypothetical protein [Ferruginibacter sp.]